MPEIGQTISHYRIIEKLGQGGMGEVFLAHDIALDRKVALKFLPDIFSGDPERLARFEREAKLLASLNHPNIATIYGLEQVDGKRFLAMELVEGETLAQQIERGPLPADEALEVCRQIAEGLEAAHEKGVIHRDLKPANVKIMPEGKVKILDFGLAKAFQGETPAVDASKSPTLTDQMTQAGIILGTAAYMAPEQAKGKAVDKRTDNWAFGCILYECLTGKQPFQGETVTETLAAVIRGEPDWKALPPDTPLSARTVLRRCLQKDASLRLRDIADARIEILDVASGTTGIREGARGESARWRALPWTIAAAMILLASLFILRSLMVPEQPSPRTMRFDIPLTAPIYGQLSNFNSLALSSDGQQLVYVGDSQPNTHLYYRRLDGITEFRKIPGLEGVSSPFFSPDGKWLVFCDADGMLKKVQVAGGTVVPLTPAFMRADAQGDFESADSILFSYFRTGIFHVPAGGGNPKLLMAPDFQKDECGFVFPQRLPGRDLILFTVYSPKIEWMNDAQIVVQSLGAPGERTNITQGTYGRYIPTGHLVYGNEGKLMAAPFDLATLKIGVAETVLDGIFMTPYTGKAEFAFSNAGHLVYIPGTMDKARDNLVLTDRKGNRQALNISRGENEYHAFVDPSLSWDGRRIAVGLVKTNNDIHVYDFSNPFLRRVTFDGGNEWSLVWNRDGTKMAYASELGPKSQVRLKSTNNTSNEGEPIFPSEYSRYPCSFSPEGDVLAFIENNPKTKWDIWTGSPAGGGQPTRFLDSEKSESFPAFSPDGHWIAYQSDKSGQPQVHVVRYPEKSDDTLVSLDGGTEPHWASLSGKELFYRDTKGIWVSEISFVPTVHVVERKLLFKTTQDLMPSLGPFIRSYAVMPDGQHFVFVSQSQLNPSTRLCFIVNWFEELKRLVPTGK